jgi:hypothetical protein
VGWGGGCGFFGGEGDPKDNARAERMLRVFRLFDGIPRRWKEHCRRSEISLFVVKKRKHNFWGCVSCVPRVHQPWTPGLPEQRSFLPRRQYLWVLIVEFGLYYI